MKSNELRELSDEDLKAKIAECILWKENMN